jgi:hypothetical protein
MTDITITLGNRPDLDADERKQRALRAKEVLNGASWAFDEFVSDKTQELIGTNPNDSEKRETLYHQIDAAVQLKGFLLGIVQQQQFEEEKHERRISKLPAADHE